MMVHRIIEYRTLPHIITALLMIAFVPWAAAQKYYSKVGRISFVSDAPLEKIEAVNNNALIVVDATNGAVECAVLIKGFQFAKALMQDHFNENYMESHLFPKGLYKGTITNIREINLSRDATYTANLKGELTLHGVTRPIVNSGLVVVKGGKISVSSTFEVLVKDFEIEIPKVVRENVTEKVSVTVHADLLLMQ